MSNWFRRSSSSLAVVLAGIRIVVPVISPVSEALNWQRTFPVTCDRSIGSWESWASFARFEGGGRRVVIDVERPLIASKFCNSDRQRKSSAAIKILS